MYRTYVSRPILCIGYSDYTYTMYWRGTLPQTRGNWDVKEYQAYTENISRA
jgi:hypothetical protein